MSAKFYLSLTLLVEFGWQASGIQWWQRSGGARL